MGLASLALRKKLNTTAPERLWFESTNARASITLPERATTDTPSAVPICASLTRRRPAIAQPRTRAIRDAVASPLARARRPTPNQSATPLPDIDLIEDWDRLISEAQERDAENEGRVERRQVTGGKRGAESAVNDFGHGPSQHDQPPEWLVTCLRALADFSQRNLSRESTNETDWRAAGQKVTFGFSRALDRDLFKNEVRRLLPQTSFGLTATAMTIPAARRPAVKYSSRPGVRPASNWRPRRGALLRQGPFGRPQVQ